MPDSGRAWQCGGTYLSTVNLLRRRRNGLLIRNNALLHEAVTSVRRGHSFDVHGWVVLPDHLHCG